jgi:hypothetical protein
MAFLASTYRSGADYGQHTDGYSIERYWCLAINLVDLVCLEAIPTDAGHPKERDDFVVGPS